VDRALEKVCRTRNNAFLGKDQYFVRKPNEFDVNVHSQGGNWLLFEDGTHFSRRLTLRLNLGVAVNRRFVLGLSACPSPGRDRVLADPGLPRPGTLLCDRGPKYAITSWNVLVASGDPTSPRPREKSIGCVRLCRTGCAPSPGFHRGTVILSVRRLHLFCIGTRQESV
jgi:hypothetical protein